MKTKQNKKNNFTNMCMEMLNKIAHQKYFYLKVI